MAKTMYLTNAVASTHLGTNNAKLNAATAWWTVKKLAEARGVDTTGTLAATVATVTGATNGIEVVSASRPCEWISEPLSADFTVAGTITLNLWAFESSNAANAAINAAIDKVDRATGALTRIATSVRITELGTSAAVANFTVTPTSTACNRGDRIRVRVFADDAGTMASGQTVTFYFDRSTAAQGESFVTFTETLTFETTAPTGSTYYPTDAASTVNPGSATEKVASTSRGSGSVNKNTTAVTGPTAPIQMTDGAGGSPIEWYTPTLEAVTLGGMAKANIWGLEAFVNSNVSFLVEIAVTAGDGTGAAVWGIANLEAVMTFGEAGEIDTAAGASTAWVAGDDTAVTAGQRLRFRVYINDCGSGPMDSASGDFGRIYYNGSSAGAIGDTYVILPQTVTEQSAAAVIPDVGMALTVT